MWAISAGLADALAGPGPDRVKVYAEIWRLVDNKKLATVDIEDGAVTYDGSAAIRSSFQGTIPDLDGLVLEEAWTGTNRKFGDGTFGSGTFGDYRRRYLRGLLLPMATQIRVFWKALLPGTTTWETVPMGRFTLTDPTFRDGRDGRTVSITGYDAAYDIAANKWSSAFHIPKGTDAGWALQSLLQNRLPGLTVDVPLTGPAMTTPKIVYAPGGQQGSDPWQDATDLAASFGWILYINRQGHAVAEEQTTAVGPSVWSVTPSQASKFEQTPSAADLCNVVVVYGETTSNKPVHVTVTDTSGPYGTETLGRTIVREYRSDLITTSLQASSVGTALLRKWGRLTERIVATVPPSPHLDPGDVLKVSSDALELDDDNYVTERVQVYLAPTSPSQLTVSRSS